MQVPRRALALALLAAAALAACSRTAIGTHQPTVPTALEPIRLSLSVTDGAHRYVGDLPQESFTVLEDGILQELAFFSNEPWPLSVALLLDCSASMEDRLSVAQNAGTRFIETLRPEDAAQIVEFNQRMTVLQDFTSAQPALRAAISRTSASGPTALYDALYATLQDLRRQGSPTAPRRRAIVLLSDGDDTASLTRGDQVRELAHEADIGFHAIAFGEQRGVRTRSDTFREGEHFLTALAQDTGGFAYFPSSLSALDGAYSRIAEELRTQYTLGYVSTNPRRDGKWRRVVVRVRVPGRDDLQVRHKLGYKAPRS